MAKAAWLGDYLKAIMSQNFLGIVNICCNTIPFSTIYQTVENVISSIVTICPSKAERRAIQ